MTTSNNFDFSSLGKINFKILSPCISPTCHHQPPNTPHLPPPFFTTSLSLLLDDGTLGSCMARTWRFTSHGHLILCRGWLCQNWKLSCTHLVTKKGSCCRQVSSPDDVNSNNNNNNSGAYYAFRICPNAFAKMSKMSLIHGTNI